MERVQRLYDCITEVSDQYIQEAEILEIRQGKVLNTHWKKWSSMAAALVILIGAGLAASQLGGGGSSDTSAPAASVPAMSEPADAAPEAPGETADLELGHDGNGGSSAGSTGGTGAGQEPLHSGMEIRFGQESYVILTPERAESLGLPEDLRDAVVGDVVCWLVLEDGVFVPAEEPTEIAMYACAPELYIVSDGEQFFAAESCPFL